VATNPGGPPPPEPFLSGGKPYFGMESSGRPPTDFLITNDISLRCFHYCPCFKAEVRGSGGEDGRRTETGCCICRENTFDPGDPQNKSCDQFKYEP